MTNNFQGKKTYFVMLQIMYSSATFQKGKKVSILNCFIKNRFFSHAMHSNHSFLCLHSFQHHPPPFFPGSSLPLSSFRKQQAFNKQQPNMAKQLQDKSKACILRLDKATNRKKKVQREDRVRDTSAPTVRNSTKE